MKYSHPVGGFVEVEVTNADLHTELVARLSKLGFVKDVVVAPAKVRKPRAKKTA